MSPETLQQIMKFVCDAPEYCAVWRENGNEYVAKKTPDKRVLLRNLEWVPTRLIRASAKRVLTEHWEVLHFDVD